MDTIKTNFIHIFWAKNVTFPSAFFFNIWDFLAPWRVKPQICSLWRGGGIISTPISCSSCENSELPMNSQSVDLDTALDLDGLESHISFKEQEYGSEIPSPVAGIKGGIWNFSRWFFVGWRAEPGNFPLGIHWFGMENSFDLWTEDYPAYFMRWKLDLPCFLYHLSILFIIYPCKLWVWASGRECREGSSWLREFHAGFTHGRVIPVPLFHVKWSILTHKAWFFITFMGL